MDLPIDPIEYPGTPEYREYQEERRHRRLYQRFVEYEARLDDFD